MTPPRCRRGGSLHRLLHARTFFPHLLPPSRHAVAVSFEQLLARSTAAPDACGAAPASLEGGAVAAGAGPAAGGTGLPPVPVHVLDQEYDMVHQVSIAHGLTGESQGWVYRPWCGAGRVSGVTRRRRGTRGQKRSTPTMAGGVGWLAGWLAGCRRLQPM